MFVGLSSLISHSFASDITNCPSIEAIKAEGITEAEKSIFGDYYPIHISTYDTAVTWKFRISRNWKLELSGGMKGEGGSAAEAIEWGTNILQYKTSGDPTPEFIACKRYDKCIAECKYQVQGGGASAYARTTDYF